MGATMSDWNERLWKFGRYYDGMESRIRGQLKVYTDHELDQVLKDTDMPDVNNCWYAVYRVAPVVQRMAQEEIARREVHAVYHDQVCALRWGDD